MSNERLGVFGKRLAAARYAAWLADQMTRQPIVRIVADCDRRQES